MHINIDKNSVKKLLYKNFYYYFIFEQDFFISKNIQKKIIFFYKKKKYYTIIKINTKIIKNFNNIFFEYQQNSLFDNKKILLITLSNETLENNIIHMIKKTYQYNNKNIILILIFTQLNYNDNIVNIKKIFYQYKINIINCAFLSHIETKQWIIKNIKKLNLNLPLQSINILTYYYARNLLKLYKILQLLKIIHKKNIKIQHQDVKSIIEDSVHFNTIQWTNELFLKNKKNALRILKYFKKNKYNILYIIKTIQINLINLINKKENNMYINYFSKLQKKYIIQYDYITLQKILNNLNYIKLYKIINILNKIDIDIKINHSMFQWKYLKILISIF